MKNHLCRLTFLVAILIPSSISCSKIHSPSNFLKSFSLSETIKQMNVQGLGLPSGSISSTASAGDPSPHRREFNLELVIEESMADRFDEQGFLAKLREKIKQEAVNSGLKVNGEGGGGDSFHINYRNGEHNGGIEVIGVRTERNKYRLWCIVREIATNDSGKN